MGVSASASAPPVDFRTDFFLDELAGSPCCPSDSRVFSTVQKHQFFSTQLSFSPTLTSIMTAGKTIALTRRTFVGKVMSLLYHMLSWLVIIFLPRNKHLLISWLQSPSAVILELKKIKSVTVSIVSHLFAMK